MAESIKREIPALKVRQWLSGWDKIDFDADEYRAKPPPHFFIFSLPARELKSLSGIYRRTAKNAAPRADDLNVQRQHDPERSEEIGRFVEFGYPWSTLSEQKRKNAEYHSFRKPGWLPTAIVLNILTKDTERDGNKIDDKDLVFVSEIEKHCSLTLPYADWSREWVPTVPPFEVIDGQHRLWAFEGADQFKDFELPVVAFVGLDISWQAYLFWTINIKPKRINSSLAFDLYPLLRSEDWLEAEGHGIYRETRAQELTEILWSYPESPWYDKINMLGERQNPWVSQNAWVKSLTATFIKSWDKGSRASGGLFGGRSKKQEEVLGWSRTQQAAFLIFAWNELKKAVAKVEAPWAKNLRAPPVEFAAKTDNALRAIANQDLAFFGPDSLLNTDQGVRGFLLILNDLCYTQAARLKLNSWRPDFDASSNPIEGVEESLKLLKKQDFASFVSEIASSLASFDWRTSKAPDLDEQLRRQKLTFKGSGGYKELRVQLLEHIAAGESDIAQAAKKLIGSI